MAPQQVAPQAPPVPTRRDLGLYSPASHGRPWPPEVAFEVDAWRRRLLAQAHGSVLDLDLPSARALVVEVGDALTATGEAQDCATYDTVVCTMQLVRFPDLLLALRALTALLAPTGRLRMLEPVHHVGAGHRLLASVWSVHPAVRAMHLERDPISVARQAGLTFTDVQRISMPTTIWPLEHVAAGIAMHRPIPVPAAGGIVP